MSVLCESIIFIQKFERVSSQKKYAHAARPLQIMFPSSRLFVFLSTQSPSDSSKASACGCANWRRGLQPAGATRQIANLKGVLSEQVRPSSAPPWPRARPNYIMSEMTLPNVLLRRASFSLRASECEWADDIHPLCPVTRHSSLSGVCGSGQNKKSQFRPLHYLPRPQ